MFLPKNVKMWLQTETDNIQVQAWRRQIREQNPKSNHAEHKVNRTKGDLLLVQFTAVIKKDV